MFPTDPEGMSATALLSLPLIAHGGLPEEAIPLFVQVLSKFWARTCITPFASISCIQPGESTYSHLMEDNIEERVYVQLYHEMYTYRMSRPDVGWMELMAETLPPDLCNRMRAVHGVSLGIRQEYS